MIGETLLFIVVSRIIERTPSPPQRQEQREKSMPKFMLAYYGGNKPASQEEGMAQMEKWSAWVKGLGDSIVNPGTPLPVSKLVTSGRVEDDTDQNSMKGFAVVKADSMAAALAIAQSDPFLESGGTIRVSQMMEMNEQGSC